MKSSKESMAKIIPKREKAKKAPSIPAEYAEIVLLCQSFYDLQQARIQHGNRAAMLSRDYGKKHTERFNRINEILKLQSHEAEKAFIPEMKAALTDLPTTRAILPWFNQIRGIGPVYSIALVATIRTPERFPTISKLWAYAGFKPGQKLQRGVKANWNPLLKKTCWKIAHQFIKQGGRDREQDGGYRTIYEQFKDEETRKHGSVACKGNHEPCGKKCTNHCSPGLHIENRTVRRLAKLFLADLFIAWRTRLGLPLTKPYIIGKGAHQHYIAPPFTHTVEGEAQEPSRV